jgi:RNA polymerase sigma-70 factor (ECF subfamily)
MDEDVQHLIRQGRCREALEHLLERYETKVFRMAVAFLKDPARAEDITQDIFIKLWQGLPDYDGRASLGTWLYAIARNTCLSFLRSESYRRAHALETAREPAAPAQPGMADFELAQLLDRLPKMQRTAITLFYLQEKNVGEVALMMGIPEGTVKSHLHRARLALGEIMKEKR